MNSVIPIHYKLRLEPDLDRFRCDGQVEFTAHATETTDTVVLNVLELAIWKCRLNVNGEFKDCSFTVKPDKEELHIILPQSVKGRFTLVIDFEGHINDKMAGFYRSRFEIDGQSRYIGVTQFEESDARRAFPCMDHPARKATFDVEMVVNAELTAISNGAVQSETPLENRKKSVQFERTPKMSTYLLFFGVGQFEFVQDTVDPRVHVATTPGKLDYTSFGLTFGRQALKFCEDYYQVPYPLSKMDLIAVPDFAFGAMENWGAITFRENLLLHFPEITSKSGEERICEVIAHEIAHQWFGNLVTPSDWKYLWLNESFATYFGYGVVDHYYPDWGVWEQFINGNTNLAFNRDALHETFAIEIPGGEHVVINTSTAPIIYSKGGSILRQIEGFIGSEHFKNGLRHYLKTHEYSNADSHHLWEALEEVSQQPVTRLMKSWIEQPGHPVVFAERNDNQLTLTQKRFTFLPNDFDQIWQIPVSVRLLKNNGETNTITQLMTEPHMTLPLDDGVVAYKVNSDQTGFYRVQYRQTDNLEALGRFVKDRSLSDKDRWGLQNDLFAGVRSGAVDIEDYLAFVDWYSDEDAYLPLSSLAGNLFSAYLVAPDDKRQPIADAGRKLLDRSLAAIGFTPSPDEPFTISILRDQIIYPAVLFGSSQAAEFATTAFASLLKGQRVHADIMKSVLQVGAHSGDGETLDALIRRLESALSEHERMNILMAMACFADPTLIERSLAYCLDHVPDRNKFIPVTATAANPFAVPRIWDWYVAHLDALEAFHPMLYERVIAAVVPVGGMRQPEAVREFFESYVAKHPQATDVVKLSLEKLEINLRMRNAMK